MGKFGSRVSPSIGFGDEADWNRHLEYIRKNPVEARLAEEPILYEFMGIGGVEFPQGLKPRSSVCEDVRAEARTLPSDGTDDAVPFQNEAT